MLLWSLLATLLALILAQGQSHITSSTSSGSECPHPWPVEQIYVDLRDASVYRFLFKEVGVPAKQNFIFYTSTQQYIAIWDCHCGGDNFSVYDQGEMIIEFFGDCADATSQCNFQSDDPQYCRSTPGFCKTFITLTAGFHNLTIVPIASYYGQGYGYLQNLIYA